MITWEIIVDQDKEFIYSEPITPQISILQKRKLSGNVGDMVMILENEYGYEEGVFIIQQKNFYFDNLKKILSKYYAKNPGTTLYDLFKQMNDYKKWKNKFKR
jgi:hypothetical protein